MKVTFTCLAVGLAALLAAAEPAFSGDWNNGARGLKDRGYGAVPVPAPVPVPNTKSEWYLRGDAGVVLGSTPSVNESGARWGQFDAPPSASGFPASFGTSPSWFSGDFDTFLNAGIGAGYYWNRGFRTDATIEYLGMPRVDTRQTYSYQQFAYGNQPITSFPTGGTVDGRIVDRTDLQSAVFLLNGYVDLGSRSGFTPYIGAGVGVAAVRAHRAHRTTERICDLTADPLCAGGQYFTLYENTNNTHNTVLAAAAMAGFSYELSSMTKLDIGYRYLYLGETSATALLGDNRSKITIGDQQQHQLRAGLRFDIQ